MPQLCKDKQSIAAAPGAPARAVLERAGKGWHEACASQGSAGIQAPLRGQGSTPATLQGEHRLRLHQDDPLNRRAVRRERNPGGGHSCRSRRCTAVQSRPSSLCLWPALTHVAHSAHTTLDRLPFRHMHCQAQI